MCIGLGCDLYEVWYNIPIGGDQYLSVLCWISGVWTEYGTFQRSSTFAKIEIREIQLFGNTQNIQTYENKDFYSTQLSINHERIVI